MIPLCSPETRKKRLEQELKKTNLNINKYKIINKKNVNIQMPIKPILNAIGHMLQLSWQQCVEQLTVSKSLAMYAHNF